MGESMFCAVFLRKKLISYILTSKLAPSLVYHALIRALLSLALNSVEQIGNSFGNEMQEIYLNFLHGALPYQFELITTSK